VKFVAGEVLGDSPVLADGTILDPVEVA